ncbi:YgaP family membrane protein [Ensifer soli]|uniref:YgaP family membrane protein n=1 Tax=Ciceribacter sp. sgz301302 TaxID=3342379 RepID=UPI0035B6FD18
MKNFGSMDRVIRLVLGLCLMALPFMTSWLASLGYLRVAISAIGLVLIVTGIIRFCPAYTLFGIRTCKLNRTDCAGGHFV